MKKVLLINDDKDFQYLVTTYLEKKGFEAKAIDETDNVIPLIKQFRPEVIIIDMKIEFDNDICNAIREEVKTESKIVLLTDKTIKPSAIRNCKPDAVLEKPFQPEELIEKIAR